VVIGSFGSSEAYDGSIFKLSIERDPNVPIPTVEPARYGKLPEIHHIFKDDPSNPTIIITLAFVAMVCAALPVLAGLVRYSESRCEALTNECVQWLLLGANVNHLPTAFKSAPLPHALFLGSLVAFEGIFFLYYTSWNLFQTLPAAAAAGAVAFLSGSRALGEVQGRRFSGLR
jgi:oligosaccharyltransferase complex subunit delta (ribophorin II)